MSAAMTAHIVMPIPGVPAIEVSLFKERAALTRHDLTGIKRKLTRAAAEKDSFISNAAHFSHENQSPSYQITLGQRAVVHLYLIFSQIRRSGTFSVDFFHAFPQNPKVWFLLSRGWIYPICQ
jgi:hypothetical protein